MITIEKIAIEGFAGVIQKVKYKFNRPGLNIISGPNGMGKTTIFNALAWVIYKQLLKKGSSVHPWPHIIDEHYRGTKVKLSFKDDKGVEYEIIRCAEFKGKIFGKAGKDRLIITQGGKELHGPDLRNKDDYQKWIIKKIGYSFDLFKSTILFGQGLTRLMEDDGPQKKKVFDEAFESVFISRARDIVDKKLKTLKPELTESEHRLEVLRVKRRGIREQITQAREHIKLFKERQTEKLEGLSIDMQKVKNKLKALPEIKVDIVASLMELNENIENQELQYKDINADTTELKQSLFIAQAKVKEWAAKRVEYSKPLKINCKECGKSLTPSEIKRLDKVNKDLLREALAEFSNYTDKCTKLDERISTNKDALSVLENQKVVYQKASKDINAQLDKDKETNVKRASLKNEVKRLKKEWEKVDKEKAPGNNLSNLNDKVTNITKEYQKLKGDIVDQKKKISLQEWLLNDPLSNSGLKAFIFDSMLSKVNNNLKAYKQLVGFEIKVYVEMKSARKDILISVIKNGNEVPFADLSGGQKQLTNVALAFALNDTINAMKPTNLLILDEAFESLSTENVEAVGNIIIKKAAFKSLHLITHQASFNPNNTYKTFITQNEKEQTIIDHKYREQ